jgi:hypothetical protein
LSAKFNLICEQAATFNFQFVIKNDSTPLNLTGYSGTMTVRPFTGSTTITVVASTDNGRMVFDELNGRITVTINSATTTTFVPSRYVYDLITDSGSVVTRYLEGKFIVTAGVTV